MQSDAETTDILRVFEKKTTAFRSALALAVEDVRATISERQMAGNGDDDARQVELGQWAAARMNANRFLELTNQTVLIDSDAEAHMQAAFDTLSQLSARGDSLFRVRVATGTNLRDAVASAYEDIGRAFGAARVVEAAKSGTFTEKEHGTLLDGLRYRRWSEAERRLAPPLVVGIDGGDLFVSALAEFLDGDTKIVLHVRGDCPPAPLVRLVNPSTYVVQTRRTRNLDGLAQFDGPGIGALVPEYAAHFTHDPSAGTTLHDRLQINQHPVEEPRTRIGGYSATQQVQDLEQLALFAQRMPAPSASPSPKPAAATKAISAAPPPPQATTPDATVPADRLAAWLLQQADLTEGA